MEKEILTTQECCVLLGVSESNLRTMMKEKTNPIPYSQLSSGERGTVRFLKSSVIDWVKSREVRNSAKRKRKTPK
ncbi:MAG: helix-turn-helix domain-containing protein [Nitrospirae bacterium]|nr:helix-turn-helix domain-containing protein [Nitrospirota bacterium]